MTELSPMQALEDLDDIAAYWMVLLESGDCTPQDRVAFEKWKRQSPLHEEAFEQLRRGNAVMDSLLGEPDILDLVEEARAETQPRGFSVRPLSLLAAAASIVVVAGLAVLAMGDAALSPNVLSQTAALDVNEYTTAVGERSTIPLSDGSIVTLNTESSFVVEYSDTQRLVTLQSGQAYFEVAKDADRPFIVRAGNRSVLALGTAFDVRYDGENSLDVTLVEGAVDVNLTIPEKDGEATSSSVRTSPISLKPGQRLIAASERAAPELVEANVLEQTIWRSGKVIFRDQPLSQVVDEMNRYSKEKLVLGDDPRVQDLKVSGVFNTGRTQTFVLALEDMHPVSSQKVHENEIVISWSN